MNWKGFFSGMLLLTSITAFAQEKKPKLVVGIVVDQMRQEFLDRYADTFGEDGFKRIQREGFELKNAHYNYMPTTTGPGHAAVYTGTTPAYNGIVYNNWFDRATQRKIYCVEDPQSAIVGVRDRMKRKGISPRNLVTTTITDEVRMSSQFRSKVLSISIKDRSAVLGGGHQPTGSYWYDDTSERFVTSTFYRKDLPEWLERFNNRRLPAEYAKKEWKPLLPLERYTASRRDEADYESGLHGTTFPYAAEHIHPKGKKNRLAQTPYGDDILIDLAKAGIEGEQLGQGEFTDFLAISFSSTDKIGHMYGPMSIEVQDTYLRLDRNLADLMNYLDEKVGKGEYLLFLTADHAVSEIPSYLKEHQMPGDFFDLGTTFSDLNAFLAEKYGEGKWITYYDFFQFNLNRPLAKQKNVDLTKMREEATGWLLEKEGIIRTFTVDEINMVDYNAGGYKGMLSRGYFPKRSGDGYFVLGSGWLSRDNHKGTSHGSPFTYDTHVPILWYGTNIPQGSSVKYHRITDIATTLSMLLGVKLPSGATGEPIEELFR